VFPSPDRDFHPIRPPIDRARQPPIFVHGESP